MHCVRNYSAAVVLSLLIATPLLVIGSLQVWQIVLKYQWEERLEREAAQTIALSVATVVWEKQDKELVIDGKLFDIFSYKIRGDSLVATGVYDEQETRLQTFLATQCSRSQQTGSIVQLLLMLQGFAALIPLLLCVSDTASLSCFPGFFVDKYADPFAGINLPPPRLHFY